MTKILFIEDESALQKTMSEVLRQEGFEVFSAYDGKTGLETAQKENPDLILLDLILPKMEGFEVLEHLKSNEDTKKIPVIVLTNLEGVGDVDRALSMGATTYLVKANYELEEVVRKIRESLKEK